MLLLDSQTALWTMDDNPRLGPRSRNLITEAAAVHVSAATVWELTIKSMLGKLKAPPDLASLMKQQGIELLNVTADHTEGLRDFPELIRHDPFDRLIVSQAKKEMMTLLTADGVLLALDRDFIADSRQ